MPSQITELVRSLLQDDLQAYDERTSSLGEQGWNAFGEVVGAAFQQSVSRRFGADDSGVSALVSQARKPYQGTPVEVDAEPAEILMRSVLGQDGGVAGVLDRLDERDLAKIELVLLRQLVADAGLVGPSFDAFLAEAESAASPWSQGKA